jgi:hypothetical protein
VKIIPKFINGIVFGISHQYYVDVDLLVEEEGEIEEKLERAPRVPMIFIYIGPLQFIVTW